MFKFLLILFLIGYLFFKIGGFIFRLFLGRTAKAAQQRQYQQNNKGRTTKDGVHIDHIPNQKGKRSGGNFKGGEYVDYEEV
ncbi:DUF4834 domain-containing protein [Marivirga arenosa]|uniref:DUF4834 domain-containing protein n=1 Tax=Marivirga arenosa TaxID=3059076 RepID=A0AA49GJ92_9BACT|nr:DUF4834 domain-containing protein [Marivirga sp. ABR2-2]WKK87051.1 DUF4834 domain-containing protein [Marivirga sp. ABR2-2]